MTWIRSSAFDGSSAFGSSIVSIRETVSPPVDEIVHSSSSAASELREIDVRLACRSLALMPISDASSSAVVDEIRLRRIPLDTTGSWQQTTSPSDESQTSASMPDAPCSRATRNAAMVFSGSMRRAPRWAKVMTATATHRATPDASPREM